MGHEALFFPLLYHCTLIARAWLLCWRSVRQRRAADRSLYLSSVCLWSTKWDLSSVVFVVQEEIDPLRAFVALLRTGFWFRYRKFTKRQQRKTAKRQHTVRPRLLTFQTSRFWFCHWDKFNAGNNNIVVACYAKMLWVALNSLHASASSTIPVTPIGLMYRIREKLRGHQGCSIR